MTHRSFGRGRSGRQNSPGLSLLDLEGVVASKYIEAARASSRAFQWAGVRHVLVGGLAVGMNGYPRHTSDVDFLVGEEAFEHHGLMVTPKAGLPVSYDDIQIDWVSLGSSERAVLEEFLVEHSEGQEPVAIPAAPLVFMKLVANRQKDRADIVELLKVGVDVSEVEVFLQRTSPKLLERFRLLVNLAEDELGSPRKGR